MHVSLIIPEERFFYHYAVFPMPYRTHWNFKGLARGLNEISIADRHRFCKRSLKNAGNAGPFSGGVAEADRVLFDSCIRSVNEHCLEIFHVLVHT